jgi:hypothetical protein
MTQATDNLKIILIDAIKLYNEGSDNEEYLRGQVELAMHLLGTDWYDAETVSELIGWKGIDN